MKKKMTKIFSNAEYREKAFSASKEEYTTNHTVEDAFFLLINGQKQENLSNLCRVIENFYARTTDGESNGLILSQDECYKLTQGESIENKIKLDENNKKIIYDLAYYCLLNGRPLGNKKTEDGKYNASDWMGHSLLEGRLAGQLARAVNLEPDKAIKYGILHDYGRSIYQDGRHIIKGFELLTDKGWDEEAIGCLTHSYLKGGRCSYNDAAVEGFYIDDEGNSHWKEGTVKDDIAIFLEKYQYTKYDLILNIADLMATSRAIVAPSERMADISKRRTLDLTNRGFFLAELINTLNDFNKEMGGQVPKELQIPVIASKGVSIEEITEKFEIASKVFYEQYQNLYKSENEDTSMHPEQYGLRVIAKDKKKYFEDEQEL